MKTILIPVDFSKESDKALEVASKVAKKINAKIVLTHMAGVEDNLINKASSNATGMEAVYYSKLTAKKYEAFLDKEFLDGITVEPVLQKQLNFSGICEFAKEIDAGLIVMGSHGSKGISEIFVGSNTEKVVRTSDIPVLVVKDNEISFEPEKILFVSDFNTENVRAYEKVKTVAEMLTASVELVYVNLPSEAFRSTSEVDETLLNFFKEANHPKPVEAIQMVNRVADYSVEQGALNFAQVSGADIIAIPTHGRKGFAHFLQGSISEDIANHSIGPVLTVKI